MADPIETPITEPAPVTDPATPEPTPEPTPPPTPPAPAEPPAKPPEPPAPEPSKEPPKEEPKPPEPDYKAQAESLTGRLINAELRAALTAQGVPETKLPYAVKLADVSGIDLDADGADAKIAKAAKAVLDALPELKGTPGAGTGTPVATPRNAKIRDAFQRGFWGDKQ